MGHAPRYFRAYRAVGWDKEKYKKGINMIEITTIHLFCSGFFIIAIFSIFIIVVPFIGYHKGRIWLEIKSMIRDRTFGGIWILVLFFAIAIISIIQIIM